MSDEYVLDLRNFRIGARASVPLLSLAAYARHAGYSDREQEGEQDGPGRRRRERGSGLGISVQASPSSLYMCSLQHPFTSAAIPHRYCFKSGVVPGRTCRVCLVPRPISHRSSSPSGARDVREGVRVEIHSDSAVADVALCSPIYIDRVG